MATHTGTYHYLTCDECSEAFDNGEGLTSLFDTPDMARQDALDADWSREGDRDLCPPCTCAAVGHLPRVVPARGYAFCMRCDDDVTVVETRRPNGAYL